MPNNPRPNPESSRPELVTIGENHLSLRTGKMSFIQYGFDADPGQGRKSHFDENKVVLLVLNDHRFLHYQFQFVNAEGQPVTPEPYSPQRDEVIILWPEEEGEPPADLAPEKFFEFTAPSRGGRGVRKWPRESFRVGPHHGEWDTALIFRDPSLNYVYDYNDPGGADDYRFYWEETEVAGEASTGTGAATGAGAPPKLVPWSWRRGQHEPKRIFRDEAITLKKAIEAEAGGPQQLGGMIPYPPK